VIFSSLFGSGQCPLCCQSHHRTNPLNDISSAGSPENSSIANPSFSEIGAVAYVCRQGHLLNNSPRPRALRVVSLSVLRDEDANDERVRMFAASSVNDTPKQVSPSPWRNRRPGKCENTCICVSGKRIGPVVHGHPDSHFHFHHDIVVQRGSHLQ